MMDPVQAILDQSDSDTGSDDGNPPSEIDLEKILREDILDEYAYNEAMNTNHQHNISNYDDSDEDNKTMSTISTTTHHLVHPTKRQLARRSSTENQHSAVDESYLVTMTGMWNTSTPNHNRNGTTNSITFNTGSHNAEDWAVLQRILGEDEDDGDDVDVDVGAWVDASKVTSSTTNVDAILESMDDEDDHIHHIEPTFTSSIFQPISATENVYVQRQSVETSLTKAKPEQDHSLQAESDKTLNPTIDAVHLSYAPESTSKAHLHSNGSGSQTPYGTDAPQLSPEQVEAMSAAAMEQAQFYENKLLKPGHRDIVSPLMVKRRLKPKIQLNSFIQKKNNSAQLGQGQGHEQSKAQAATNAQAPRFGFSGVMENKVMPSLSAQLVKNQTDRVGLPTALSVNSKFIAIGTQKGDIFVFDLFEVLRQHLGWTRANDALGSEATSQAGGSVTSVDISFNGEALISGYTSGTIVLWDIIKGSVLKMVTDAHPSPITICRFLKDLKVVTIDAGGLVNKLNFAKNILWSAYSMETECLLDGTAGQILAMNVLHQPSRKHPSNSRAPFMERLVMIALSSERSSFAVAVEPQINVLHRWPKPPKERILGKSDIPSSDHVFLPCLAWGWSLVAGGDNAASPILARGWGCCLQMLQATIPTQQSASSPDVSPWPAFGLHDEFDADAPIVALEWLGERSLVYLTVSNEFTVVDTVMMTMLERLDFSRLKLVYAEFSLSRSATKESTTPASGDAGLPHCTTFQNSIRSSDNRLLVLCRAEIKSLSILSAKRRITALEEDGEWLEALALALDHYENTVSSQEDRKRQGGARDLSKHPEFSSVTRTEDEEWIAKLLIRYFNLAVENAPETERITSFSPARVKGVIKLDLAKSHFQMLAGVCVEFCVVVRRLDLLFGPIFRRFLMSGYVSVFLDVLEPYVLNDKLAYIAPEVMSHFVEHCKVSNGIATVERCLLHMDVTIMDFDSIISLLKRNEMYSALFHVFTHGLDDHLTPLEIIFERIFDSADLGEARTQKRTNGTVPPAFQRFGYKAILYLQHSFRGRTFPRDTRMQPDEKVTLVRPQLLRLLLQENYAPSGNIKQKSRTGVPIGYRSMSFPYTQILLMVDARAVLDTFSIALDAPDSEFVTTDSAFESIGGWEVEVGAEVSETNRAAGGASENGFGESRVLDRQQIITMLSSIICPDENSELEDTEMINQSTASLNAFLDFMAKYLVRGVVRANRKITYSVLGRLAQRYSNASLTADRKAAQRQMLDLLSALPRNAYEPDKVLKMVEIAGIHRAALLLHQQGASAWHEGGDGEDRRAYHFRCAIDCYLDDSDLSFRTEVFDYAKNECSGANASVLIDSVGLRKALVVKLPELVALDAIMSAQLVAEIFVEDLDDIVAALNRDDGGVVQFSFLHAVISGDLSKVDIVASSVLTANLTMSHYQKYLALMAKLHPDMVYVYLSTHDNYRPEACLKLCQQYDIVDASAYLLERMGNVSSGLQLLLQTLESRMMHLKRTTRGMGTELFPTLAPGQFLSERIRNNPVSSEQKLKQQKEMDDLKHFLGVALDLCQRNSGAGATRSEYGSQLWFNVLDRLINAKGFLRLSKEQPAHAKVMSNVLSDLLQITMQRMVSSVPLSDLVRKVTADNSGSRLGEVREMIESLLKTYGHEMNVFSGAVKVMHSDMQKMEVVNRELKLQGDSVHSVMQHRLSGYKTMGPSLAETYARIGCALKVGDKGDAAFTESGQMASSRGNNGGLSGALDRLYGRRKPSLDAAEKSKQGGNRAGHVGMLCTTDTMFYEGKSSEAAARGDRLVGALGDAQSFGSLHWI